MMPAEGQQKNVTMFQESVHIQKNGLGPDLSPAETVGMSLLTLRLQAMSWVSGGRAEIYQNNIPIIKILRHFHMSW